MVALILAAALAATPSAAPSPSPSPPPLKTIVTVKASATCGAFAAHVNSAIASAVGNDQTLTATIFSLRQSNLADNDLSRNRAIMRLSALGDSIYKEYRSGLGEVKQLRDLASKTADPAEKQAIRASADALGGALYRQHLVQRDLEGFVAYLQTSDMRNIGDRDFPNEMTAPAGAEPTSPPPAPYWTPEGFRFSGVGVGRESWRDDDAMAAAAADDFQRRLPLIFADELTAGHQIEQAGDHC